MNSPSPFSQFRARSMLTWPLLTFALACLLTERLLRLSVPDAGRHTIIFFEFELTYGIWIFWQCSRNHISVGRLMGYAPRKPQIWIYLGIAVPLIVVSDATIWMRLWIRSSLLSGFNSPALTNLLFAVHRPRFPHGIDRWAIVSIVLSFTVVPFVEEFLFRGLLLHRWGRKWGTTAGLVISS